MRYAKIKDNNIEWYEQPSWLLGNCAVHAKENGYKDVEYVAGNEAGFEELADKIVITEVSPSAAPRLLIFDSNAFLLGRSEDELKATDIDLLNGLERKSRSSRGYEVERSYLTADGRTAITREFTLEVANGAVGAECSVIKWYDEDGNVALEKEIRVPFSAKQSAVLLADIRRVQINYLQNPERQYISPQVEAAIRQLWEHYKEQTLDYLVSGSAAFENAVKNETNAQIKAILDARLPDGKTIRESILYQITWLKEIGVI